jgi:orotate phosphoribosyltransferase-like protein
MDNESTTPRASEGATKAETIANLDKAAELLARGLTPALTAKELGVKPQTVRQWLVDHPALRKAVNAMRADATEAAYNRLTDSASEMAGIMLDGARDMATPAQVRAADLVLARIATLRDAVIVEERLASLEAQLAELRDNR